MSNTNNPSATIDTSEGQIVVELWPEHAPNHVANIITLAEAGFYDGKLFHRVIDGFMIQTGCPHGSGTGDAGYKIGAEFNKQSFKKGVLGMARAQAPDSAGSQFFICVADATFLDRQYTAFGCVLSGQDVADKISMVPRGANDRPKKDVAMKKVTITKPPGFVTPKLKKG